MGAYSRTNPSREITERIRDTIDEVGVSITLTSVTSALAFGLGCLSSIPAVFWLCLYAFPTIIFVYMYSLTFFVACIVLDERRIQANRRDCCVCITVEKEDAEDEEESSSSESQDSSPNGNFVDAFMVHYAEFLLRPAVKVAVILGFIAWLLSVPSVPPTLLRNLNSQK